MLLTILRATEVVSHNNIAVDTSPTRYRDHQVPFTEWATSRNHTCTGLEYSPCTHRGTAAETPGRHNAWKSPYTMPNRLRRFTLRARRPYLGPILNRPRRVPKLHWVTDCLVGSASNWWLDLLPMCPDLVSPAMMSGSGCRIRVLVVMM